MLPNLILIVLALLAAGGILLAWAWPKKADRSDSNRSLVRAWIAMVLAIGLVLYAGVAVFDSTVDAQIRTALVTGLTTSVAAAVAFYFSAKSGEQAVAAVAKGVAPNAGTEDVPDLRGRSVQDAAAVLGTTGYRLAVDAAPVDPTIAAPTVQSQSPEAGARAVVGSSIVVTLG